MSTNDRPSIFSIIFSLFPSCGEKTIAPHFARHGWMYSKACRLKNFTRKKVEDLTCCCLFNIKQSLAKKLDPRLKPRSFEGNNVSYSFLRTKVQINVHAVSERDP